MNDGSISSLPQTGRINQKMRTRRELLRGARELMQAGKTVTVAAAAKHVGISTATAYRYFSDPDTIKLEAVYEMDLGETSAFIDELKKNYEEITNIADRVVAAHRMIIRFIRANENPYRLFIAQGHEAIVSGRKTTAPIMRNSARMPMFELAIEPLRRVLSAKAFDDAVLSLCAASGPEPYFALKDLCGQTDEDIDRISEGNLRILTAAITA